MATPERAIKTCSILNIDKTESTIKQRANNNYDICNGDDPNSYIVSDTDEELLILIEFEKIAPLTNIKIFAAANINNDADISAPKSICIYPTKHLNLNFDDINAIKSNKYKSVKCSAKQLRKGQVIKLIDIDNIKFKYVKYLVIYIKTNQNDTESTYLNGILFNSDTAKYKVDKKEEQNIKLLNELLNTKDIESETKVTEVNDCASAVSTLSNNRLNNCKLMGCTCLNNISSTLQQYRSFINRMHIFQTGDQEIDDDNFDGEVLINDIYNVKYNDIDLLNDFHHLLLQHASEFEDIYNLLNDVCYEKQTCDLSNCLIMRRNQRNRFAITKNESILKDLYFNYESDESVITQQLIDRIHCYYLHSFDTGFKLTANDIQNMEEDEIKSNNEVDNIDINIQQLYRSINARRSQYQHITELTRLNSRTNKFSMQIEQHATGYQLYSYGVRYFYWPYYKNKHDTIYDDAHNRRGSEWVRSSFSFKSKCGDLSTPPANGKSTVSDWYITPKYQNFKQELLINALCNVGVTQLRQQVEKAGKHLETVRVKQMKCKLRKKAYIYGLHFGDQIQQKHLIAIMIYCNFDVLQREFSQTYRRKNEEETPQQMKQRHSHYYFLGKLLRECVECFGMNNADGLDVRVYHGVGQNHIFSSMFAHIKGPFSTTTEKAVAVNFCNHNGMILELNIKARGGWEMDGDDKQLCCFDCQWISDFANESEIFCIGGLYKFTFNTIIQAPDKDYMRYINGIKQMTHYMSAGDFPDKDNVPNGHREIQVAFRLLSHEIWRYKPNHKHAHEFKSCPDYIKDILHEHCESIKTIFITNSMHGQKENKVNELIYKYDNGWMNIELLIMIYPNTDTICYDGSGKDLQFLKMKTIYNSVLRVLQMKTKLEYIDLVINPEYHSKMNIFIEEYKKLFNKYSWDIRINFIENIYKLISSVSGADNIKSPRASLLMHRKYQVNTPSITINYI